RGRLPDRGDGLELLLGVRLLRRHRREAAGVLALGDRQRRPGGDRARVRPDAPVAQAAGARRAGPDRGAGPAGRGHRRRCAMTMLAPERRAGRPAPGTLRGSTRGRLADPLFKAAVTSAGVLVLVLLAFTIIRTTADAWPIFRSEGLGFFTGTEWEAGHSRDLPNIHGTYGA